MREMNFFSDFYSIKIDLKASGVLNGEILLEYKLKRKRFLISGLHAISSLNKFSIVFFTEWDDLDLNLITTFYGQYSNGRLGLNWIITNEKAEMVSTGNSILWTSDLNKNKVKDMTGLNQDAVPFPIK